MEHSNTVYQDIMEVQLASLCNTWVIMMIELVIKEPHTKEASTLDYNTTYVGMDVHKATISVAIAEEGRDDPVSLGLIPNSHDALLKLLKKLEKPGRKPLKKNSTSY